MPKDPNRKIRYPFRLLKRPMPIDRCYPRDISSFFSDPKKYKQTKSYSGSFACLLHAYTPLEVNAQAQTTRFNQKPLIPGASIKGVVRSVAEFVGGGCASIISGNPNAPEALCGGEKVCPSCALFGNMTRGAHAQLLRGRVQISDAIPYQKDGKQYVEKETSVVLYQSSPKKQHSAFYGAPSDLSRQKFYHHQKNEQSRISKSDPNSSNKIGYSTLHPVKAGSIFSFHVSFAGLDARLVALLHYALTLEPALLHKMGRGKSFGLGSVKIEIQGMEVEDARARYLGEGMSGESSDPKGEQALPKDIQEERKKRFEENPALDDFRKMLCFEATQGVAFGFPDHAWFKANSQIPLYSVDEALDWQGTELTKPLSKPPSIELQSAPVYIDTTPVWVKEHGLEDLWEALPDLRALCRKVSSQKYGKNLLSSLSDDIDKFRSFEAGSDQATLIKAAFRQMFGENEKGWNAFYQEHLLGLPPAPEPVVSFSLEDDLAQTIAAFAERPPPEFFSFLKERMRQNIIPKEHRAAWAKTIIQKLQQEKHWEKTPKGTQKQAQETLRAWERIAG